jgi:DNA polymerase-3 subunit gamma/tau
MSSYTALARKWRPKSFAEMSGQEHVLQALGNALDSGRVHHAFLFTGTRGVGKTTVARIFAKCLNCERGVSATPCGECASCREIDAGRFLDLIEVDAASRTKVDDTRELLENVQYAPTRGRYKVYLIDEVHMLSAHSFNALLKTLEEPPPHVKFLLATTDPQKLPVTVLSRCLQFNLKRLSTTLISARLAYILAAEGVECEAPALRLLAIAADGSLRDALSLLDQLLAFGNGRACEADAVAMLGTVNRSHVVEIAELLAAQDAAGLVRHAQQLEQWAPDYAQLLDELNSLFARVAVLQVVPDAAADEDGYPPELLHALTARIAAEDLQLYYQIGVLGRRDLNLVSDPRVGFVMTLVRMLAFRPQGLGLANAVPATGGASVAAAAAPPAPVVAAAAVTAAAGAGTLATLTAVSWSSVAQQLELTGLARQLASHCAFVSRQGVLLRFALDPRHQAIRSRAQEEKLVLALSRYFGEAVRIEIEVATPPAPTPASAQARRSDEQLGAARAGLESDPTVLALKERFGAQLHPDSVRLLHTEPATRPEEK